MILARALILLPLLVLGARTARAQTDPHTVETRADSSQSVEDPRIPSGFVTRIDLGEDDLAGDGLASALESAPGISIRRQSSFGQPAYLQIRGGNPRQVVVLLNGIRVKVPSGLGFDVGSLGIAGFDSARLYRGSSGVIHGAGALAGALELRAAPTRTRGWMTRGKLLTGSFGTRELSARAEGANHLGSARLTASQRMSRGDFSFEDRQQVSARRNNNAHQRTSVLASGAWRSMGRRLGGTVFYEQGRSGVPGPSEFQQVFGSSTFTEKRLIAATDSEIRDILSGQGWSIDFERAFGLQWRDQIYANPNAVLGGGAFESNSTSVGLDSSVSAALYNQSNNFLRARLSARRENLDTSTSDSSRLHAQRATLGAALSDEQLLFDERLSLVGVARLEKIEELERTWTPFTGAVGALVRPAAWMTLRGNVARTFRAPDFDELYLQTEFIRGNPELEPEKGALTDLGIGLHRQDERLSGELTFFGGVTRDQIAFLPASAYLIEARNLGRVRTLGAEVSAAALPHPRLPLSANYTLTDAVRTDASLPLPNQPRHRINATAQLDLSHLSLSAARALPALRLETRVAWRSAIALDTFATTQNPGWWRLDAGAVISPTSWLRLRADGTNLLNYRRAVDGLQRPLPGRAFFLSIELEAEPTP